ncbi:MAG TPA: hypothetical protein PKH93_08185 [Chitinophagales bacterium]|jgi:uncharacterized membrane protein YgcG|nr:hypothetical protein [Chitinophagales bacterium]
MKTPKNQRSKKVRTLGRSHNGTLFLALSSLLALNLGACSDGNYDQTQQEQQQQLVRQEQYSKGVITHIKEVADGEFKIVDETTIENPNDSRVIIENKDGKIDTLNLEQAKTIVMKSDSYNSYHSPSNSMLSTVLWWSFMGNMMGRSFSAPAYPAMYVNNDAYRRTTGTVYPAFEKSRTVTYTPSARGGSSTYSPNGSSSSSSPSNSRSGFFRSSRSSSGG